MGSPQTLHDFVLNLLSNPDALMAFQVDPEAALSDAGLSDVNVQDVQEVIPLVMDYAPTQSVAALEGTLTGLAGDALNADPSAAIQQIQLLASQLPTQAANDLSVAASRSLVGGVDGLAGAAALGGSIASGLAGTLNLSTSPDLAGHLGGIDPFGAVSSVTSAATGMLADPATTLDGMTGTLGGVTGMLGDPAGALNEVTGLLSDPGAALGGLTGTLGGVAGMLGDTTGSLGHDPASLLGGTLNEATGLVGQDSTGALGGTLNGVTGTVSGATGALAHSTDGLSHDPTGALTGALGGVTQGVTGTVNQALDGHALSSTGLTGDVSGHGLDLGGVTGGGLAGGLLSGDGSVTTTHDSTHALTHATGALQPGGVGDLVGQVTQSPDTSDANGDHLLGIPLL